MEDVEEQTVIIDLIRHGQSESNVHETHSGSNMVKLTPQGIVQARLLGEALARSGVQYDILWHSGLPRTIATMENLVEALPLKLRPGRIVQDLKTIERQHPDWDDRPYAELNTPETLSKMNLLGADFRPPNGESFRMVESRMAAWLVRAQREARKLDQSVVHLGLVSHGHAIRCLLWHVLRYDSSFLWRIAIPNTALTRLRWSPRGWFVDILISTSHLGSEQPYALPRKLAGKGHA